MRLDEKIEEKVNDKILKLIESKAIKTKKFNYPFGKKVGKSQRKKNYVTVIIPYENGSIDIKKYQIEDQTIIHDKIPRLAPNAAVMLDRKGNPVLILPNWSVSPFSPLEHYKQSLVEGSNAKGYKILMAKMKSETTEKKKMKVGKVGLWIFGLLIVLIIVWAIASGGAA